MNKISQNDLKPHHQITEIGYMSSGEDPFFHIDKNFSKGWYFFEYQVNYQTDDAIENDSEVAKFYIDYGEGFKEHESVCLPIYTGKLAKRIIYLKGEVKHLRFDPLQREGSFVIKHFAFKKVFSVFALDRILKKQFSDQPPSYFPMSRYLEALRYSLFVSDTELGAFYRSYNNQFQKNNSTPSITYEDWIAKYEQYPTPDILKAEIAQFKSQPVFSIVMPTYNTEEALLCAALDSVIAQSYPHWELCIADDHSPSPHVCKVLKSYAKKDARIHYVQRETNGHISAASNSALELAKGNYVVLMDHDDTLAEHALYEVARLLEQKPELKIIYTDEDKIDYDGIRSLPHFKSDWNRDLFYSHNYITHLVVYQHELLKKVGGFRLGVEGSQDYDLLLRCVLHVTDPEIGHIPKVLYHWRMIVGSTALGSGEKSYTSDAGMKALEDHFIERGIKNIRISTIHPNVYRIHWPLPKKRPLVSLIIPTRDGYEILKQCIDSIIEKTTYQPYEILIVDNESSCEKTLAYLKECGRKKNIRVLPYHHPFNYSAINNYAVQQAKGEIIGLINNDIEVINPDWLTEMVSHAIRPDIGCVGAKLYYGNDAIQHAGVICGIGGIAGHSHKGFSRHEEGYFSRLKIVQNLSAVTAAVLVVKKRIFLEVGGLNEIDLKIAFNDVDFCLKVRKAGYRNVWTPFAELYHHESVSRGFEDNPEKIARFEKESAYMKTTWNDVLECDPFYSPNLTLDRQDFSIKD